MDIEPEMIRQIHHKAKADGVSDIEPVIGKPDDPGMPPGTDLIFGQCAKEAPTDNPTRWLSLGPCTRP